MKRFVCGIIFLSIIFCAICFAQEESQVFSQKDDQSQFLWDFGKVKEGAVLKHEFVLKNSGLTNLKITNLQPSCGCLSAKVKKKELLAQESTVLEVSFDSKGEFGPLHQFVYVQTDNLDNPVLRYIIKVQVEK